MNEIKEFFTPRVQYDLIQTVQMQNESFEDALKKYTQGFICRLADILVRNYKSFQEGEAINAIKRYIGLDILEGGDGYETGSVKYLFTESETTKLFACVQKCYNSWIRCEITEAIKILESSIAELLEPDSRVNTLELNPQKTPRLYRGRISETPLGKGDMFHIKFKELYKIRNQRFSLVGQPLLYLGASVQCVAEEMHINSMHQEQIEQLFISQYTLLGSDNMQLYDMRLYIQDSFFDDSTEEAVRRRQFKRFLLSCICSFNNYHNLQDAYFIEEYIIPQLVIQEIRKEKKFCGICYYSTRFIPEGESLGLQTIKIGRTRATISDDRPTQTIYSAAENYAFFTNKSDGDDPWDRELKSRFDITMPVSISELRRNSISFQGSEDGMLSFSNGVNLLDDYFRMRDAQEKNLITQEWYRSFQKYREDREK